MAVFQIIALVILILGVAWAFHMSFVEAVPVGVCIQVLLLYVLCFGNGLWLWDYISVALLVGVGIFVRRMEKEKRKELLGFAGRELFSAGTITAILMTVLVAVCVCSKSVSWWDDYNFWATDVKSIFFLDGFAGKHANVAAEFGDYPPGTQMMKWWFLHLSPKEFKEGLMFAGYYFLNMSFLFPFLKHLKKRNPLTMMFAGVLLWLFPSVAEAFWIDGCCADLTMAMAYGAFLVAVIDRKGKSDFSYYGRQALYLMVVVLCKNTGFIWVAFGLVFAYGYHILVYKKEAAKREKRKFYQKGLFWVTLLPVLTECSWLGFCVLMRRVAKLTGTAIRMATGEMNLPAYQGTMVKAFLEAFVKWPLHRWKTPGIDLSPLVLFLLLIFGVVLLRKFHLLERMEACYIGVFMVVSGVVFYCFNLISHLTIFAVETQYLEPFGMVSSIERYGAPFMFGGMILLAHFLLERGKGYRGVVICALFILLCADHAGAYRGLYGYREQTGELLAQREEIVDEAAIRFLGQIGAEEKESIGRVLYLRDVSDVSWVRNTYVGFEAAPVSVMYGNVDADTASGQDIVQAVTDAHADFLYVDELQGDGEKLFDPFLQGEKIEYGRLYQVIGTGGGMEMRKYDRN